jgi:hypothetical protein
MVSFPNWTDPQFLDATGVGGLNAAMGTVSGAIASAGSGTWAVPGLISPEAMTVSFASLVATVGLPLPWSLITSSGAIVRAHGTQTGVDTTSYSVNFAPLVPASGSRTAFLAATVTQIQQNPFPIPGPPPGDPAYNPNFVPTTGYATNQYSIILSAVSGGIDNINTFELFRTTLTVGQSSITSYNTVGQVRASDRIAQPVQVLASGGVLTQAQSQYMLSPGVSGLTHTLPLVSGAGGLFYWFVNPTASWTIATSGTDTIVGLGASGLSSVAIPTSGALLLWGNAGQGQYQTVAITASTITNRQNYGASGTYTYTVPAGVYEIFVELWGSTGGSGGSSSTGAASGAGGGGYCAKTCAVVPGQVFTITIGAGGTAGGTATNGGNGGVSTVVCAAASVSMTANAGVAGLGATGGGANSSSGGTASGGDVNLQGGNSGSGVANGTLLIGGSGGASPFGGGITSDTIGTGQNGNLPGGGPGGGANAQAGVTGNPGWCRITVG